MKREVAVTSIAQIAVLLVAVVFAVVWLLAASDPQMVLAAIGLTALLIVLSPFLVIKTYDLFSPWTIVLLTIFLGCTAPAFACSFNWPSVEYVEAHSMLGSDPQYYYYPGMVLILGLICLTVGYFAIPYSSNRRYSTGRVFSPSRLYIVAFLCIAISFVATAAFVSFTGGTTSSRISGKRTNIRTLDVKADKEFSQYGYLRTIATLSNISLVGLLALWSQKGQKITLLRLAILAVVFLLACVIPFYSSSRASLVWLFLAALGVSYYSYQEHLFKITAFLSMGAIVAVAAMTILRNETADVSDTYMYLGKNLVFSRNGPELAKTAHIINGLPEKLDYQYGKTVAVWLIAPIPRELYPGKPLIHYGPVIGRNIYGNNISGVPPGLIAEMYLNFHIPGVIFGCMFFGWALRKLYEFVFSITGDPAIMISVYCFAFLPLAFKVLGNSFGSGILCFVNCFIIVAIVYFCSVPAKQNQLNPVSGRLHQANF